MLALLAALFGRVGALQRAIIAQTHLNTLHLLAALIKRVYGAGVDPNTHGNALRFASLQHFSERIAPTDKIARIDTDAIYSLLDSFKRQMVIIMNIGNQRD